MGLLGWLRGEPSVGDKDYRLYHQVQQQLGKSRACPTCGGSGRRTANYGFRECETCDGGGYVKS